MSTMLTDTSGYSSPDGASSLLKQSLLANFAELEAEIRSNTYLACVGDEQVQSARRYAMIRLLGIWPSQRDQCGIKKQSSSTRKITAHKRINVVRPFPYIHAERGSLFCLFSGGNHMIQCYWISFIAQESMKVYNS